MNQTAPILDSQQPLPRDEREQLRAAALQATQWDVAHRPTSRSTFAARANRAREDLKFVEKRLADIPTGAPEDLSATPERVETRDSALREIRQSRRQLRGAILDIADSKRSAPQLPRVVLAPDREEPRPAELAALYFRAVEGEFSPETLLEFVGDVQAHEALTVGELWSLPIFLKFALLESILADAKAMLESPDVRPSTSVANRLSSLSAIGRCTWTTLLEPLIAFEEILRQDPAGAYAGMDFDSRQQYRNRVAFVARHSDFNEVQVAQIVVDLAREAGSRSAGDGRRRYRESHVGFYIVDAGFPQLTLRTNFHPTAIERVRTVMRGNADDFYITAIEFITIVLAAVVILPLVPGDSRLVSLAFTCAWLLVPISQLAVEFVNTAITTIFSAQALPKLDFSEGIPADCATLVTVPTLLLHEAQVRELVADIEIRYLANRDPHLHFILLTDLPDSVTRPREKDSHPLVELAIRLIDDLNTRYSADYTSGKGGAFLLLHRHRIFNRRQAVWMGWERKRGKLLDLNKLLRGEFDAFPVKAGPQQALHQARYVLTLDSDTQLPRGSAAKLVGCIAHPLNQAIIDPQLRIVTAGYGILQPRVGVTVQSASRSRLAAIYSGQTGLDTYTRAVSDAYQDLCGEGIFTGKGIYEVETLHSVLDHRFPRNVLLSHDLIEGAYARAGLATDVEIIDDYPSHYSAYTRRKHRWVRGDWQIAQWIFSRVPEEGNRWARNPISYISRWKIFDNLRRSLVDPLTCILLVAGWIGLPGGPLYWTIVTLLLLIFPALLQLAFGLTRNALSSDKGRVGEIFFQCAQTLLVAFLYLVFLPHQMLLSIDAIVRSLVRQFITGEKLLEWETAAQAESRSAARTPVDRYLTLMPVLAVALAALVYITSHNRYAIFVAAPILLLWGLAGLVPAWLNSAPREQSRKLESADQDFLLDHALRIWRFFSEFSSERHNYLIPDNVEEDGLHEAARVSPTNAGFLLNARQAACEFGFLTVPEFSRLTQQTLNSLERLEKYRGHLYNWYDTHTLEAMAPRTVSSVDSGNFVASLYTLRAGALALARQPLLTDRHRTGLHAHWQRMESEGDRSTAFARPAPPALNAPVAEWIDWLALAEASFASAVGETPGVANETRHQSWWQIETRRHIVAMRELLRVYFPWMLPEFAALRDLAQPGGDSPATPLDIASALAVAEAIELRLTDPTAVASINPELLPLSVRFRAAVSAARNALRSLAADLGAIAQRAERLAEETDFSLLVHPSRTLLSIGYDPDTQQLHDSCYDLLASESRIATFLAVARDQLPQRGWFNLGRTHTQALGQFVLLSWTGTMFEYLMPSLWMRSYPETLMARTLVSCVRVQRIFARPLRMPWGISESGFAQQDDSGHYQYHAFGIPEIALKFDAGAGPVISPYSTFLALAIDQAESLRNLRRMADSHWVGAYGFYEAVDYSAPTGGPVLVREWMAHHQGMALLAITNLLCDKAVQQWFHANPLVQATELLLHERPINQATLKASLEEFAPI